MARTTPGLISWWRGSAARGRPPGAAHQECLAPPRRYLHCLPSRLVADVELEPVTERRLHHPARLLDGGALGDDLGHLGDPGHRPAIAGVLVDDGEPERLAHRRQRYSPPFVAFHRARLHPTALAPRPQEPIDL